MVLIRLNAKQFAGICDTVLNSCFASVNIAESDYSKVKALMSSYIGDNATKYASLGLHYIIQYESADYLDIMRKFITPYARNEFIKLLSMTNNLSEFTSIPVKDGSTETSTQNGRTFSMSENQPINAIETISTPYIKVSGKNNYTNTKETQHNTVNEYKTRQEIMNGNVQTIFNFLDSWMEKLIYEYNIAY